MVLICPGPGIEGAASRRIHPQPSPALELCVARRGEQPCQACPRQFRVAHWSRDHFYIHAICEGLQPGELAVAPLSVPFAQARLLFAPKNQSRDHTAQHRCAGNQSYGPNGHNRLIGTLRWLDQLNQFRAQDGVVALGALRDPVPWIVVRPKSLTAEHYAAAGSRPSGQWVPYQIDYGQLVAHELR
jgi:hypothetical protein